MSCYNWLLWQLFLGREIGRSHRTRESVDDGCQWRHFRGSVVDDDGGGGDGVNDGDVKSRRREVPADPAVCGRGRFR